MRFLVTSDPHFTEDNVSFRSDDMREVSLNLLNQIENIIIEEEVSFWLNTGDLLHNSGKTNFYLLRKIIEICLRLNIEIITALGQHDIKMGAINLDTEYINLNTTALGVLEAANVLQTFPVLYSDAFIVPFHFFQENIPEKYLNIELNSFKILLAHKPISEDDELTRLGISKKICEYDKCFDSFDAVFLGDIHKPFYSGNINFSVASTEFNHKGKIIANFGPLVRTTITDKDIVPKVGILDIDTKKLEFRSLEDEIHIQPEYKEVQEILTERLQAAHEFFSDNFQTLINQGKISFTEYLKECFVSILEDKKIPEDIKKILHLKLKEGEWLDEHTGRINQITKKV